VARIDAPQFYRLSTAFFSAIDFKAPELNRFISHTPTLGAYDETRLIFLKHEVLVRLHPFQPEASNHRMVEVKILCEASRSATFNPGANLYLQVALASPFNNGGPLHRRDDAILSRLFSPRIALVLKELTGGRITEVLPALQNVLLEGFQPSKPVQKGIAQFIAARQLTALTDHPVAVSVWHRDFLWD